MVQKSMLAWEQSLLKSCPCCVAHLPSQPSWSVRSGAAGLATPCQLSHANFAQPVMDSTRLWAVAAQPARCCGPNQRQWDCAKHPIIAQPREAQNDRPEMTTRQLEERLWAGCSIWEPS